MYSNHHVSGSKCHWWDGTKGQKVSENFWLWEFTSGRKARLVVLHPALVWLLEDIRKHFGAPVHVNSGYRSHERNIRADGAAESRHLFGFAADIRVQGQHPDDVAQYARSREVGGIGWYDNFTHVDVEGHGRRWDLRTR